MIFNRTLFLIAPDNAFIKGYIMLKTIIFAFAATVSVATESYDRSIIIQKTEINKGAYSYKLVDQESGDLIGSLKVMVGDLFKTTLDMPEKYNLNQALVDPVFKNTVISYKAVASSNQHIFMLCDFYIKPEYRGQGYAQLLLNQVSAALINECPD